MFNPKIQGNQNNDLPILNTNILFRPNTDNTTKIQRFFMDHNPKYSEFTN